MKHIKKVVTLFLAFAMVLAMSATAFAAKTVNVGTGTGSITLENGTTGEKYQLYKVFDATYSGENVSYTFTKTAENNAFFTLLNGADSPFKLTATATENVYTVVTKEEMEDDDILAWVETNVKDKAYLKVGAEITLAEADNQKIEWTNLAFGYYMITSTLDDRETGKSYVTIDSNVPDVSVIDKNQKPTFDKNIVDDPENPVKVNEAGLNEDVKFDITVNSKNYDAEDKIFKYVIYDTLDAGWTLKATPVVKIAGETKANPADYTISLKDKSGVVTADLTKAAYFEITIPWTSDGTKDGTHLYKANDEINVTYTAFLDPEKAEDVNVGATPNKNEADVKYYKGNDEPDSTTPSGDLPNVKTETFDTAVTIQKTDDENNPLKGAEFKLTSTDGTQVSIVTGQQYVEDEDGTFWKLNDGTYTTTDPSEAGVDQSVYEDTETKYALENVAEVIDGTAAGTELKAFVGEDGKLTFSGLGAGTYTLVETTVPAGFNKADDITFTISFNSGTKKFASDNEDVLLDSTNNVFKTTVVNQSGVELPSTGGIGTVIFYVLGSLLVIGCGIVLVSKRRMNANK